MFLALFVYNLYSLLANKSYVCCFPVIIIIAHVPRQTKIGNFHDEVFSNQNISCCQISVNALENKK